MRAINRVQHALVSRWPPRSRLYKETALETFETLQRNGARADLQSFYDER